MNLIVGKNGPKDYQDYIARQYNDPNDRAIYHRTNIKRDLVNPIGWRDYFPCLRDVKRGYRNISMSYLAIAGTVYPLICKHKDSIIGKLSDYTVLTIDEYAELFPKYDTEKFPGIVCRKLDVIDELSVTLMQPIFYPNDESITVVKFDGKTFTQKAPNLTLHGVNKLFTPEEIFTKISAYVDNVIYTNSDTMPPVEVSNIDKIIGHGYDIKKVLEKKRSRNDEYICNVLTIKFWNMYATANRS